MTTPYSAKSEQLAEVADLLQNAGLLKGLSGQLSARYSHAHGEYSVVLKRSGGSLLKPEVRFSC